jgi:hypothetical protein
MDLVEILKRLEGKTLEFKRDLSSRDGAFWTIVAFANTAGGTLLIGVEDCDRNVRGEGFDGQPMSGLNSEALDFRAASESFASLRATRTRLARLVNRGLVREIGTGPQYPRRRYFLAERGPA